MSYTIDLKQISVLKYREILKNKNLLPGRKILLKEIDKNFKKIIDSGIDDLSVLKTNLSSAKKISSYSLETRISINYLTILKREIGSLEQKSINLCDFPDIKEEIIFLMSSGGIKTSKDFYKLYQKSDQNAYFANIMKNNDEFHELFCLCNLVRINGVGAIAAKMIYGSGYEDIKAVANADPLEMLNKLSQINSIKHYYGAKLGSKDIEFMIYYAKFILDFE